MISTLFASVTEGRLDRLHFLGYALLLAITAFAFMFGVGIALGLGERAVDTQLGATSEALWSRLGFPLALMLVLLFSAQIYAQANILAKRIRDIGLPAWPVLLVTITIEVLVWVMFTGAEAGLMHLALIGVLLLVPGNCIARRKRSHFGNRKY